MPHRCMLKPPTATCLSLAAPFSLQVRKEARAAIQRERDQQVALMIAK